MRLVERLIRLCLCAGLGCASIGATPVAAATIGINDSVLTAFTDSGDDVLSVFASGTNLVFAGVAFAVVTPGCSGIGTVSCALSGLTEVRVNMLAGDDALDLTGLPLIPTLVFTILGGDGDDVLLGSRNSERMYGGTGDDVLIGGGGVDCLSGGTGVNVVLDSKCDAGADPDFPPAQPSSVPVPDSPLLLLTALGLLALTRSRLSSKGNPARIGVASAPIVGAAYRIGVGGPLGQFGRRQSRCGHRGVPSGL